MDHWSRPQALLILSNGLESNSQKRPYVKWWCIVLTIFELAIDNSPSRCPECNLSVVPPISGNSEISLRCPISIIRNNSWESDLVMFQMNNSNNSNMFPSRHWCILLRLKRHHSVMLPEPFPCRVWGCIAPTLTGEMYSNPSANDLKILTFFYWTPQHFTYLGWTLGPDFFLWSITCKTHKMKKLAQS